MKKILITAVVAAAMFGGVDLSAQYAPTSTWPYVYENFRPGSLNTATGVVKEASFNVCIANGRLHFIDGAFVREMSPSEVAAVRIGPDSYVNVDGRICGILSVDSLGMVVEKVEIDYARLNTSDGAYGSSGATIATRKLSSAEGIGDSRANMNHLEMLNSKEDGKILPLVSSKCLVCRGKVVPATREGVIASGLVSKEELKTFMKSNKIKWNDSSSLQKLVDFLCR